METNNMTRGDEDRPAPADVAALPKLDDEVARLRGLSVSELLKIHRDVFGRPSSSRHQRHLVRRIAWGLQARVEGDLSEQARRRAAELVDNADLRVATATAAAAQPKRIAEVRQRLLLPGTVLLRPYKGCTLEVTVLEQGFEYNGQVFSTLSAVAKSVTGSHWNGYRFFGLTRKQA